VMPGSPEPQMSAQMSAPPPKDDMGLLLTGLANEVRKPVARKALQKPAQQGPPVSNILGGGENLVLGNPESQFL
jgi:hypothetical protein